MSEGTFRLIEAERTRLADLGAGLSDDQWHVPSLARGWRVLEVFAHLTMPFRVRMPALLWGLARHRFSFDTFADAWARDRVAASSAAGLVGDLREHAGSRFTPPGMGPEVPLADLVVHGLDIRMPLALATDDLDPQALASTLAFLTTKPATSFGVRRGVFESRRFQATDLDWAHGTGPVSVAPAAALIAHLTRRVPLPE